MYFVWSVLCLLLAVSYGAPAWADSGLDQDMQIWTPVNLEVPVTENISVAAGYMWEPALKGGYMLQLINRHQAPNGLNHNVYLRLNVTTPTLSKLGKPPIPPLGDFRRPQEDLNF